jgi:CDP-diacylglycerol--glycerol-3-phosphate 3-phosphatidyltransferase/cardiolipin synthase
MGTYRARDLLLPPSLLSMARVPLAAAFPFVHDRPWAALGVLAASAFSDMLDGWWARRYDQATATGAVVDPITDKIFVLTVVITLIWAGDLSPVSVVLLSTREIGELPLVVWLSLDRAARQRRKDHPKANGPGKAATTFQFIAVIAALFHWKWTWVLIGVTAVTGVLAAVVYWVRWLRPEAGARATAGEASIARDAKGKSENE